MGRSARKSAGGTSHGRNSVKGQTRGERKAVPVVVAAVTHFERPAKLFDAVMSLAAQTYAQAADRGGG